MRQLQSDPRAVSAIVGTLLIVVITVAAASAFAAFISQKQGQLQKAQLLQQKYDLENLQVTGFKFAYNTTDNQSYLTNITVKNLSPDNITIFSVTINGFNIELPLTDIEPYKQKTLTMPAYNYFNATQMNAIPSSPVTLSVWTTIKVFQITFFPPSAIYTINIQSFYNASATAYEPFYILDGSHSSANGDAFIVNYQWTNSTDNTSMGNSPRIKVSSTASLGAFSLTVTDNYGMQATAVYNA